MKKIFLIQRGRQKSAKELFSNLNLPDYYYDFRSWNKFSFLNSIALLLKAFLTSFEQPKDIDVLLCEGSLCTLVGIFYKMFNKKVFLISYIIDPAFWIKNKKRIKIGPKFRAFLHSKYVGHTVCVSNMVLNDGLKNKFINQDNSSVIPLHSTLKVSGPLVKYKDRSFNKLKIISLIYVIDRPSETSYTKGLDIVFEICERLFKHNKNFKLSIFGRGTEDIKLERPWLLKKGFSNLLTHEYKKADFLLLSSRYDAGNISVLEAISHGLIPIVSSNVGTSNYLEANLPDKLKLVHNLNDVQNWANTILNINNLEPKIKDSLIIELQENIKQVNLKNATTQFQKLIYEVI